MTAAPARRGSLAALACLLLLAAAPLPAQDDPWRTQRDAMVDLVVRLGVRDSATLAAMRAVPRHEFVPAAHRDRAYGDHPLPIELGQSISQPYLVADMTETLRVKPGSRVLEVGTGSGYQAAVLAELGLEVYTMEIFGALATTARERLERLGYGGVRVRHGDGHDGWPEEAPFDAVIVTAAAGFIPPALVDQLRPGGRMVIPVGSVHGAQHLILVEKTRAGRVTTRSLLPVRFVPMLQGPR